MGTRIVDRQVHANCDNFEVKTDKYQGSALSRLLYVTVMEALSIFITVLHEKVC